MQNKFNQLRINNLKLLKTLDVNALNTGNERKGWIIENNRDELKHHWDYDTHRAIDRIVLKYIYLAQFFGLLPVQWGRQTAKGPLQFRFYKRAPQLHFSFLLICIYLFNLFLFIKIHIVNTIVFNIVDMLVFFGKTLIIIRYILIAHSWPQFHRELIKVHKSIQYHYKSQYSYNHIYIYALINFVLNTAEICLFLSISSNVYMHICPAAKTYEEIMKLYCFMKYQHIFTYLPYSKLTAVTVIIIFELHATYMQWAARCVVELVCLLIQSHYKMINDELFKAQFKEKPLSYWKMLREDYDSLACLTHRASLMFRGIFTVGLFLNGIILVAAYTLGVVGRRYLKNKLAWHMVLAASASVMARNYLTIFSISGMHKESKAGLSYLYSVPSNSYNIEVSRILQQISNEEQCISIYNYFSVTRSLLMKLTGLIATYLLVMMQMADPELGISEVYNNTYCNFDLSADHPVLI